MHFNGGENIPHPALQEYVFSISTVDVPLPEGMKDVVTPYPTIPFQSSCSTGIIHYMCRTGEGDFEKLPLSVV